MLNGQAGVSRNVLSFPIAIASHNPRPAKWAIQRLRVKTSMTVASSDQGSHPLLHSDGVEDASGYAVGIEGTRANSFNTERRKNPLDEVIEVARYCAA
jgi:hypothetical protein